MTPGIYPSLDEATYHAHPSSLSVTGAKTLLKAPALFKWQQDHPVHKDVFDVGSAAHKMVLEAGPELVVVDADSWRTKAAKDEQQAARDAGKVPILFADYQRVDNMAAALRRHPLASALLSDGDPEVSAFAMHEPTGVLRRARFDYIRDDLLVDFKTAACANPSEFRNSAARYGYHQQAAWYTDVAEALGIEVRAFVFVIQEKDPPYLCEVVELTPSAAERGRELNTRALERFRDCTESGVWPGYTPGYVTPIDLPKWAYYDQETDQ